LSATQIFTSDDYQTLGEDEAEQPLLLRLSKRTGHNADIKWKPSEHYTTIQLLQDACTILSAMSNGYLLHLLEGA